MLDFGSLPPEINSARIYAGPGSAPMMAAATAWSNLAAELSTAAAAYGSVVSELTQTWIGPSSTSMVAASTPYVAWLDQAAARAQQTAAQSRSAAAAYESAFTATVPPPVVGANRTLLTSLVATNFLGQNTPAIAATEAAYAEMWAQDATAMYGYDAASSAAAALTPFGRPPQTTNPTGQSGPPAEDALSTLLAPIANFNTITGWLDPAIRVPYAVFQGVNLIYTMKSDLEAHPPAPPPSPPVQLVDTPSTGIGSGVSDNRATVLANAGRATRVGGLSVPQSWSSAVPATGQPAEPVGAPASSFRALPSWARPLAEPSPVPPVGPMRGMAEPPMRKSVLRTKHNRFAMPRPSVGG